MLGGESKIEGEFRRLEERIQKRSSMPSYPEDLDIIDSVKSILCELKSEQQRIVELLNNAITVMEQRKAHSYSDKREIASPLDSLVRRVQFAVDGEQHGVRKSSPMASTSPLTPSKPFDMSMATYNYMQKYHLFDEGAPASSTKILDEDYIRQMPKL